MPRTRVLAVLISLVASPALAATYDWGSVHRPTYWCFDGISLHALRLDME